MKKLFTNEQIKQLRSNPNVEYVSECQIRFSADFKAKAYQAYMDGKAIKEIFLENGINPETIGDSRVYSFMHSLREKAVSDSDFTDKRHNNTFPSKPAESFEEEVFALRNQVAYLTQEVEFLKKNLMVDMEARKSVELQLQRMKNLNS